MEKQIVIETKALSKTYNLYKVKSDFIKEAIHPFRKKFHTKFYALKDVSFSVNKGEVVGIIGRNGSGKSTLLKILASVVTPTEGEYKCSGKVAALLELSGGFNNDLTGIQNIKFLGALQGYTKKEMKIKIKDILDFAEIGEYAYQPVKTYSSGMYMRLAFSLSINIDPDLLIVDEILGVGDLKFKEKCYNKIENFKEQGKTIIICTHSLSVIDNFCTKAIWMNKGKLMSFGNPKEIVNEYKSFISSENKKIIA